LLTHATKRKAAAEIRGVEFDGRFADGEYAGRKMAMTV
jgi:hypothetical protein